MKIFIHKNIYSFKEIFLNTKIFNSLENSQLIFLSSDVEDINATQSNFGSYKNEKRCMLLNSPASKRKK